MEIYLKKNEVTELAFPMIDDSTPADFKDGLSVADTAYRKDGAGAWTAMAITDTATEIGSTGMYQISLTAAEMNHDYIIIKLTAASAADQMLVIKTYTKDIDDNVGLGTDAIAAAVLSSAAVTKITNDIMAEIVDGSISVKVALQKIMSYAIGKIAKSVDVYTYYKQDNSTVDFTLTLTSVQRTRS